MPSRPFIVIFEMIESSPPFVPSIIMQRATGPVSYWGGVSIIADRCQKRKLFIILPSIIPIFLRTEIWSISFKKHFLSDRKGTPKGFKIPLGSVRAFSGNSFS